MNFTESALCGGHPEGMPPGRMSRPCEAVIGGARPQRRADPGKHCAFSCCCCLSNLRASKPECEMAQCERKSAHPTAARTERRSALDRPEIDAARRLQRRISSGNG